jgi:ADP-ribose pyrophosphatase YjhB (NUDIX family)
MDEMRKILPAVSVAIVRGDTVLLVKRARQPSQGFYAFPGGKVEVGETLEEAAKRELMEETGLQARNYRPLREIHIDGGSDGHPVDYLLTVFGATYAGGEPAAGDDAETAAFYTLSEMTALPLAASVFAVADELLRNAEA